MSDSDANGKIGLRAARDRTGLSREKVAARIGISSKTLERWEDPDAKGHPKRIKRYLLQELAALYGIDVDDFNQDA